MNAREFKTCQIYDVTLAHWVHTIPCRVVGRKNTQGPKLDPCGRKGEGELAELSKNVKCAWFQVNYVALFSSSSVVSLSRWWFVRSFVRSFAVEVKLLLLLPYSGQSVQRGEGGGRGQR